MANKLIYIDDERSASVHYREKLEGLFEVSYFSAVPTYQFLEEQLILIGPKIVVQDVMLPQPGNGTGIIDNNVGIRLLEEAKDCILELNVKVVVFSNRMLVDLQEEVESLGFPAETIKVLFKPDTGFANLARECVELIDE
jgi:hypothetical protein